MKKISYWLFVALFGAIIFAGCSDDDDDVQVSDIPAAVVDALEAKYPNLSKVDWEIHPKYYVAEFWQEGVDTQVWINYAAEWVMTEYDWGNNLSYLPPTVLNAFQSSQYATWRVDDVDKFVRTDLTFYRINVEKGDQLSRELFYREDGTLLKDVVETESPDISPDTVL